MKRSSRIHMSEVGFSGSEKIVYEDQQVGMGQVVRPGISDPTWGTYDFGLGGHAYSVLEFQPTQYVDMWIQSRHAMALQSVLDYHSHWSIRTNSAGDKIRFQVDVIAAGIGESFAVPTGSPFTAEYTLDGTEAAKHMFFDLADIPGVNTTVSTAYGLKFQRIAASSNEYAGDLLLIFADGHMRLDSPGSLQEDSKV